MRARSRLLAGLMLLSGCASTGAPPDWLPKPEDAARDPYGAWVEIRVRGTGEARRLRGELLAVDGDSLWILEAERAGMVWTWREEPLAVGWVSADCVKVSWFDPDQSGLVTWGLLGSLSTGTHGVGLLISLPVWVFGSAAAVSQHVRTAIVEVCPDRLRTHGWRGTSERVDPPATQLRPYARFPAGMPEHAGRLQRRPARAVPASWP